MNFMKKVYFGFIATIITVFFINALFNSKAIAQEKDTTSVINSTCQVPTGSITGKTATEYLQNWLIATKCFSGAYIKEHFHNFKAGSSYPKGQNITFQFVIDGNSIGTDHWASVLKTSNGFKVGLYVGPLKEYKLKISKEEALKKFNLDNDCAASSDMISLRVRDQFSGFLDGQFSFDSKGLRWIKFYHTNNYVCTVDALSKKLIKEEFNFRVKPAKPVIYLYPLKKQEISVKLFYQGKITNSYPEYDNGINGWKVIAYPDGHLVNLADKAEYSYLFWEGSSGKEIACDFTKGFIVAGRDTAKFLQKIMKEFGLTPKEYNEFIVYWLPKMKDNKYNLIHFAGKEYEDTARLDIQPKQDSLLRVFMVYRPIDSKMDIIPQDIKPFVRKGFTVVEWGGTEFINNRKE